MTRLWTAHSEIIKKVTTGIIYAYTYNILITESQNALGWEGP